MNLPLGCQFNSALTIIVSCHSSKPGGDKWASSNFSCPSSAFGSVHYINWHISFSIFENLFLPDVMRFSKTYCMVSVWSYSLHITILPVFSVVIFLSGFYPIQVASTTISNSVDGQPTKTIPYTVRPEISCIWWLCGWVQQGLGLGVCKGGRKRRVDLLLFS